MISRTHREYIKITQRARDPVNLEYNSPASWFRALPDTQVAF